MNSGRMFSRLIEEYGSQEKQEEEAAAVDDTQNPVDGEKDATAAMPEAAQDLKDPQALMQEEERLTGAVSWSVYTKYFGFAGGILGFLLLVLFVVLAQGAQGEWLFPPCCEESDLVY